MNNPQDPQGNWKAQPSRQQPRGEQFPNSWQQGSQEPPRRPSQDDTQPGLERSQFAQSSSESTGNGPHKPNSAQPSAPKPSPPQYNRPQNGPQNNGPQYNGPQGGRPGFEQSPYGQPAYGQPEYGQPEYSQPRGVQGGYGQAWFTQAGNGHPQYGQQQYAQSQYPQQQFGNGQPGNAQGWKEEPAKKSDKGLIFALVAAILAIILAVGTIGWFSGWFGNNEEDSASPSATSTQDPGQTTGQNPDSSTSSTAPSSSESEAARPQFPALPNGAIPANSAAESNSPAGDFNNVYRGTTITTAPFALATRDVFVENYLNTQQTNATLQVYSPVTTMTYTMTCKDNKQFITCTGGNNAVVYIS